MSDRELAARPADEAPPFLGRWRNVYLALLVSQAVLIGLLALLTALAGGEGAP